MDSYICPLCGRPTYNTNDIRNSFCTCCGSTEMAKSCEHQHNHDWKYPVEITTDWEGPIHMLICTCGATRSRTPSTGRIIITLPNSGSLEERS